jgi:hypothetical protein
MMIERAAAPYIGQYPVTVTILAEHDRIYNSQSKLREVFGDKVKIVVLEEPTTGPADTVYQTILKGDINRQDSVLIKDSDGFYNSDVLEGNVIYVCNLNKNPHIKNVHAKSYTVTNDQGLIVSVVEKQIVSNNFCAGGYQFESAGSFMAAFDAVWTGDNSEYRLPLSVAIGKLEQSTQYNAQAGLSYAISPVYELSAAYYYTLGAEATINGLNQDNQKDVHRYQVFVSAKYPIGKFTVQYGSDLKTENGYFEDQRLTLRYMKAF